METVYLPKKDNQCSMCLKEPDVPKILHIPCEPTISISFVNERYVMNVWQCAELSCDLCMEVWKVKPVVGHEIIT